MQERYSREDIWDRLHVVEEEGEGEISLARAFVHLLEAIESLEDRVSELEESELGRDV